MADYSQYTQEVGRNPCKHCQVNLVWLRNPKSGKKLPFNEDGSKHDCFEFWRNKHFAEMGAVSEAMTTTVAEVLTSELNKIRATFQTRINSMASELEQTKKRLRELEQERLQVAMKIPAQPSIRSPQETQDLGRLDRLVVEHQKELCNMREALSTLAEIIQEREKNDQ